MDSRANYETSDAKDMTDVSKCACAVPLKGLIPAPLFFNNLFLTH